MESDGIQHTNDFATIPDQSVDAIADRIAPRQVASGVSRGIQQLGSDKVYSDGGNQQIIVEDSASPRVLMGNQKTFGEGLYVSKTGINAVTNTDPAQWIFNSNQNVFKIALTNTASVAGITFNSGGANYSSNQATTTVVHNLGYIPGVIAYVFSSGGTTYQPTPNYEVYGNSSVGYVTRNVNFTVDNTNLYIFYNVFGYNYSLAIPAITVKYYLLQETAS